jgi:hypothetical protein
MGYYLQVDYTDFHVPKKDHVQKMHRQIQNMLKLCHNITDQYENEIYPTHTPKNTNP